MPVGSWNWPWCPKVYVAFDNGPYDEQDLDLFDRANTGVSMGVTDTVKQSWATKNGSVWGISGNQAYMVIASTTKNDPNAITLITGGNNGIFSVQMGNITASNEPGVVFRARDESNFWCVKVGTPGYSGNYYLELHDANDAISVSIQVPVAAPTTGDLIVVTLNESSIQVSINGTLRLSTTQTALMDASSIGLLQRVAGASRFSSMSFYFNNLYDISQYILDDGGIFITHGRKQELDVMGVSTCTLTLNNKNGVFDPTNTASPFYGKLRLRRRIYINMLLDDAIEYRRFTGHIMRWPQFDGRGFNASFVQVECAGVSGILGLSDLAKSYWANYVATTKPWAWYRLTEPGNPPAVLYDSSRNARHLYPDASLTRVVGGADSINKQDTDSKSLNLGNIASPGAYHLPTAIAEPDTGFTVAFFIDVELVNQPVGVYQRELMRMVMGTPQSVNNSNYVVVRIFDDITTSPNAHRCYLQFYVREGNAHEAISRSMDLTTYFSNVPIGDAEPHFVVLSFSIVGATTTMTLEIDGIDCKQTYYSTFTAPVAFSLTDTSIYGSYATFLNNDPYGIFMDETVFWDRQLTSTERADLAVAALTPGKNDTVYRRLNRITDWVGVPPNMREFQNSSITTLTTTPSLAPKALSEIQNVVEADFGAVYDTVYGKLKFRDRRQLSKYPYNTPSYIFGDGGGAELPYENLVPTQGDEKIINVAIAKNVQGEQYTAVDFDSKDIYGYQAESIDNSYALGGVGVRDQAEWLVTRYGDPGITFQSMRVSPMNSLTMAQAAVSIGLEEKLTVRRRRPGNASLLQRDVVVMGYKEVIDRTGWVLDYNLTGSLQAGAEFMVLDDAHNGIVGSYRAGY